MGLAKRPSVVRSAAPLYRGSFRCKAGSSGATLNLLRNMFRTNTFKPGAPGSLGLTDRRLRRRRNQSFNPPFNTRIGNGPEILGQRVIRDNFPRTKVRFGPKPETGCEEIHPTVSLVPEEVAGGVSGIEKPGPFDGNKIRLTVGNNQLRRYHRQVDPRRNGLPERRHFPGPGIRLPLKKIGFSGTASRFFRQFCPLGYFFRHTPWIVQGPCLQEPIVEVQIMPPPGVFQEEHPRIDDPPQKGLGAFYQGIVGRTVNGDEQGGSGGDDDLRRVGFHCRRFSPLSRRIDRLFTGRGKQNCGRNCQLDGDDQRRQIIVSVHGRYHTTGLQAAQFMMSA
jgi:hypothetical protein